MRVPWDNRNNELLENTEFAAIAVAHNIREMISKGYQICAIVTYKQRKAG